MASRDLHNNINVAVAVDPFVALVSETRDGNGIDLRGYESCEFVMVSGTMPAADGTIAMNIQESDDDSSYTDVAADELLGSEATFDSADDNAVTKVGYRGIKRYVRAQVVVVSASTGADHVTVLALRGHADYRPVS